MLTKTLGCGKHKIIGLHMAQLSLRVTGTFYLCSPVGLYWIMLYLRIVACLFKEVLESTWYSTMVCLI